MHELTDSYCERCGTRYTFGSGPARGPSLAGARLLAKSLKNFVMTDGTSMDEAVAAARIDVTKDESSRVAEEFHRTFNFCMTCRQYACDKCWNENQGACLSCAPLWDRGPIAPEDHIIVRTPVTRQNLEGISRAQWPADAAPEPVASGDAVPWPLEDQLPGRPDPRLGGNGHKPPIAPPALPLAQTPPIPQARTIVPGAAPVPTAPAEPGRSQPQPRIPQPRAPSRVSDEERSAAQQLHAQSQTWKSPDDGWTLWPLDAQPAGTEMTLTAEELQLVEAQLSHVPPPDEPLGSPISAAAPEALAFAHSHTLEEDAARVIEPEPGSRSEPERPFPGAWEPETPAPRKGPSSDFDLLGSLREPIELPASTPDREPWRALVIGRLLGHRGSAVETPRAATPAASATPGQVEAHKQRSTGPKAPWPVPTPWVVRPIERHDWWADTPSAPADAETPSGSRPADAGAMATLAPEVAAPVPATPEPVAAPAPEAEIGSQPEPEPIRDARAAPEPSAPEPSAPEPATLELAMLEPAEPVPAPESTPDQQVSTQQSLFGLPPASTDRWAAAKPDIPTRVRVEWTASDPLDARPAPPASPTIRGTAEPAPIAAQAAEEPAAWPPIGASWPAQAQPTEPWPVPQNGFLQASAVAAAQAEQVEESPLVAALWAESAQQVLDRGTVRVCHRCALPVSTQARYCRRCGTQQG